MQIVLTAKANSIWQQELNKNVIMEFSLPTGKCFVVQWADFPAPLPLFLAAKHKNVIVSIFSPLNVLYWYHTTVYQKIHVSSWQSVFSVSVIEVEQKYMKNAQHRRNSAKYKPGNTGVRTGGLAVSTFSFPACSLNIFANTEAITCVVALQGINR